MTVKVVLYYSNNCKYCTQFKPTWNALKKTFEQNKIRYAEYEASQSDAFKEKEINGYPTIRIETDSGEYEYEGPRVPEDIMSNVTSLMKGGAVLEYGGRGVPQGEPPEEPEEPEEPYESETEKEHQPKEGDQDGGAVYESKYKKYKAKYIQLKEFMEKNGML